HSIDLILTSHHDRVPCDLHSFPTRRSSDLGSIFNQVQTSNKAYNSSLKQLSDRGLPVYQWLAKEDGVSEDAVFDMAANGEISAEVFRKAIENNVGGAAKIIGEKSFTSALANVWAAVGRIGAAFLDGGEEGKGLFSQLKPLMVDFTETIDGMGDKAEEYGVKFGEIFMDVVEKVKGVVNWFKNLDEGQQQ